MRYFFFLSASYVPLDFQSEFQANLTLLSVRSRGDCSGSLIYCFVLEQKGAYLLSSLPLRNFRFCTLMQKKKEKKVTVRFRYSI